MKTTIKLKDGDVKKLSIKRDRYGSTLIQVYDGTGGSDNDLLIQAKLYDEEMKALIKALKKD